ncbi:MAG: SO_0444 family Cu/Zn efflux transporter [Gammaproteobacteria bacterium]|nr:SO_0444 family Cu/Zn efflux transporter [Gammaproteobacteria bacterium]
MIELLSNIWTVYLDTAFWLLLGLLAAGMVKAYLPEDAMQRWLGGTGLKSISKAALFGAPLPLCSCGVLPAAIGVRRSGASKEATVSFLISTPETSIDSVTVTYALMGPFMAVYRPLAALASAVVTGLMTSFIKDDGSVNPHNAVESSSCSSSSSCCAPAKVVESSRLKKALFYASAELMDDISFWLAIGIVGAGVITTLIPPGLLAEWGQGVWAMLFMVLVGVPMYICAVASTPIAAGLLLSGVSPGTVLVFLLVGPATNIASLVLLRKELGSKVTAVYLAGIIIVSIIMGLLLDLLVNQYGFKIEAELGAGQEMLPAVLVYGSAVLLLLLAIRPVRKLLFKI